MLEELVGEGIVVDMHGPYVCMGTLAQIEPAYLVLRDADLHDLRDTETTRENYIIAAIHTGIHRNRKKVLLMRSDIVAVSRLKDVVEK